MPDQEQGSAQEPEATGTPPSVRARPNIVSAGKPGFRKRYEAVGYWVLLSIVLLLVIWFLVSSASDSGKATGAEATVRATLFAPEIATAAAAIAELTQTAQ